MGFADSDFLAFAPEFLAGVKKAPVGKLGRAVRAVDDGGVALRPGDAAIGGANHPLAEFGFSLFVRNPVVSGEPTGFVSVLWEKICVCEGGEGGDEQGAFGGFQNSGIAIVDRSVENGAGKGPRFSVVMGSLQIDPSEGADVLLPSSRAHDEKLPVFAAGHGGPTMVTVWELTNNFGVDDLRGRRSVEVRIETQRACDSGRGACLKKASA